MKIRLATREDIAAVSAIYEAIHTVEENREKTIGWIRGAYPTEKTAQDAWEKGELFVMELDGRIIGQNMFMRAVIEADDGRQIPIMTMGPICIANDLQRQGYGKLLLDYSLEKAKELGCGALCFEGNIGFYGKSGFGYAREKGLRYRGLPEGADDSFFLCRELIPGYLNGVTGVYGPPEGYFVDEAACEEFDRSFPPKVKLKLPGQLV